MENRYQHDASTSNLLSYSFPVEWLLEESQQLRGEKTACFIIASLSSTAVTSCRERQLLRISCLRIPSIEAPSL
jgi:hypothetical protein